MGGGEGHVEPMPVRQPFRHMDKFGARGDMKCPEGANRTSSAPLSKLGVTLAGRVPGGAADDLHDFRQR